MKVVITGSDGFLGRHLRARCLALAPTWELACAVRDVFDADERLLTALDGADAVAHLAGINRGDPEMLQYGNVELAERLVWALEKICSAPTLVYADSVHAAGRTPYGRGKAAAARTLHNWANRVRAPFVDLILPNLFGEGGRPYYNSFVATFCHRLARAEQPEIHVDRELSLLHAQDAAAVILSHLVGPAPGTAECPPGVATSVGEVLHRLEGIAATYDDGRYPDLSDPFTLCLFNTYRSHVLAGRFPMRLVDHRDVRGAFYEAVRAEGGQSQASFSTTRPGVTRGDHFHLRKVERFVVIRGHGRIAMRPAWGGQVHVFDVSGDQPAAVDMPTLYTHNIKNVGDEDLYTMFWTNEVFRSGDADTFPLAVG